jgi:hypothetical protein
MKARQLFRPIQSKIQTQWLCTMKRKWILVSMFLVVLLLTVGVGLSQAQGPEPPEEQPVGASPSVSGAVPIQGRLTDASGNPLDGNYDITARIYAAETGGPELCGDMYSVTVDNGLFNMKIDDCTASDINGQQLYLGIKVGSSDPEMIPRQPIYPVPYAWSLRPGAIINNTVASGHGLQVLSAAGSGASGSALWVENTNASGIALWATNSSATSNDASLVVGNSGTGPLIKGFGGDGFEDEFRVNNDGSIESNADSYIFVPGTEATLNALSTGVVLEYYGMGQVVVNPSISGTKNIQFGFVLPSVLYGQPVKVEEVTIFYNTSNSRSYIANTKVLRQKTTGEYYTLVDNGTDRNSTTYTSYSVTPTADNTLSADEGFISVYLTLYFGDAGDEISIGGVRIRLGHGLD